MKTYSSLLFILLASCQSGNHSVTVGKSYPDGDCREVGQVIGMAHSRKNSYDKSLHDLKYETRLKGGDYVRLMAIGAHNAVMRGIAYKCR